jgi:hypothetical protein
MGLMKPNRVNRIGDQLDLLAGMRSGVAGIGPQSIGRNVLDLEVWHCGVLTNEHVIGIGA